MKTIFYLAMTEAEISSCGDLPDKTAWMACHFSPYGTGLTNLPTKLPPETMVILNDRIPIRGHDHGYIASQLESLSCGCLLLDLQRPDISEARELIRVILSHVKCPVAVPPHYAGDLDCPVFLPLVPADEAPFKEFNRWEGREIWLDVSPGGVQYTFTKDGAAHQPVFSYPEKPPHKDAILQSSYGIDLSNDTARFILFRSPADIGEIMAQGRSFGLTRGVGLYQEWRSLIYPVTK